MFKCTEDNMRDEVRASIEFRDKFLGEIDTLIQTYHARYYRSDRKPDRAVTLNHAFEFISLTMPMMVYDNPRVRVRSGNPHVVDEKNTMTMGGYARGIELALNRWSRDADISEPLTDMAINFFFCWAVAMVTSDDQPGFQGSELIPRRPSVVSISPWHYFTDAVATQWYATQNGGPRFQGHQWKADYEDLLGDPEYDQDAVRDLMAMTDSGELEEHDPARKNSGTDIPKRGEVIAWDVWVPEKNVTDEDGFNGSIYTLAANHTPGGVSKASRFLRKEVAASCPPWGPYVMFGAYKVPRMPYPMSPLVAVAEQSEEANAHTTQAARDAKHYKKFSYSAGDNPADQERILNVRHGEHTILDNADKVGHVEVGGVTATQMQYVQFSSERLREASGISAAQAGGPQKGVTATAESAAITGREARLAGLKRAYRRGVQKIYKSAGWEIFHGEDQVFDLGEEGARYGFVGKFQGGASADQGRGQFNYFDMSLEVDPLSMEHTDQGIYQKRVATAIETLAAYAPTMVQTPYIKWEEPMKALFDSINVGDVEEWMDKQILQQMQGIAQQMTASQAAGEMLKSGQIDSAPGSAPANPTSAPDADSKPSIGYAKSIGGDFGQAYTAT